MLIHTKQYKILGVSLAATAIVVIGAAGVNVSAQTNSETENKEVAITGGALDKASAAALQHTGQGRVTETEVGDEESYYEVEVSLNDGRQTDVQLDESFKVVGDKTERDTE